MFKTIITSILILLCSAASAASTKVLLVRHGETDWNVENRMSGQADISLNAVGKQQAIEVANLLKASYPEITGFYSSDLKRAMETAQTTANLFNAKLVKPVPALRELDAGEGTGLTGQEILNQYGAKQKEMQKENPHLLARWDFTAIPGQETYNQGLARVKPAIAEIARHHIGETIVLFAHSGVIKLMVLDALQSKEEHYKIPNCDIIELTYDPEADRPFQFVLPKLD